MLLTITPTPPPWAQPTAHTCYNIDHMLPVQPQAYPVPQRANGDDLTLYRANNVLTVRVKACTRGQSIQVLS